MHAAGIVLREVRAEQNEHESEEDDNQGIEEGLHRTFYWMKVTPGNEIEEVKAAHVVQRAGVPQKLILKHIDEELQEEEYLRNIPVAFLFIIVFALSTTMHRYDFAVKALEDAITFDIEENANFAFSSPGFMGFKTVYDVNSYADFFSWMRLGLRAILMSHEESQPEDVLTTPDLKNQRSRLHYLNFNRVIGGIRMQQVLADPVAGSCSGTDASLEKKVYGKACAPWDPESFALDLHFKPTQQDMIISANPNFDSTMQRWILLWDSKLQADKKLLDIETEQWVSEESVILNVEFLVYNAHEHVITMTTVNVMQSRSGHLWRTLTHSTQFLTMYGFDTGTTVFLIIIDIIFVSMTLWILGTELFELIHSYKFHKSLGGGCKDFLQSYIGFWNCVDWICGAFCLTLIFLFLQNWMMVQVVREQMKQMDSAAAENDADAVASLFEEVKKVTFQGEVVRVVSALIPICALLRLMKYFAANPRLSVVTRTLSQSRVDVAHFGIVFMTVFAVFSGCGMMLMGREVPEFASFWRAVSVSFRILLGDFDVDTWKDVGRMRLASWLYSYIVLVLFIMLGMLLAMIMDTYTDIKGKVLNTERLDEQIYELYRRGRMNRLGGRVSLNYIRTCFMRSLKIHSISKFLAEEGDDPARGEHVIRLQDFMQEVPGLERPQALRLMATAVEDYHEVVKLEHPLGLSDAMRTLAKILIMLEIHTDKVKRKFKGDREDVMERRERANTSSSSKIQMLAMQPASRALIADFEPRGRKANGYDYNSEIAHFSNGSIRSTASVQDLLSSSQPSLEDSSRIAQRSLMTKELGQRYDVETLLEAAGVRICDAIRNSPSHSGLEALAAFLFSAMETSKLMQRRDLDASVQQRRVLHAKQNGSIQDALKLHTLFRAGHDDPVSARNDKLGSCPSPCVFSCVKTETTRL